MPDTDAGGRAEGVAMELLPKPEEDSRLCSGQQASDSDHVTREICTQEHQIRLHKTSEFKQETSPDVQRAKNELIRPLSFP